MSSSGRETIISIFQNIKQKQQQQKQNNTRLNTSYTIYNRCLYGHESIYDFDNALQRLSAS
jgi:hypothetical protein